MLFTMRFKSCTTGKFLKTALSRLERQKTFDKQE